MPIEVKGPYGEPVSFPDGTSHEQINTQMLQRFPEYANPLFAGQSGTLRPYQAPGAGTTTPAGGNIMPSSQVTPGYLNDEDYTNLALGAVIPHAAQILQHSPGLERRRAQERELGTQQAKIEERQRVGTHLLSTLHQVMGAVAFPGGQPDPALNSAIGPVNSIDMFQRGREAVNVGDVFGTRAGYDLHNRLEHAIHALTTAYIGAGGSTGNMSDSRQAAFRDTMGRMMNATNPQDFLKIIDDADFLIRETFDLQQGRRVDPTPRAQTRPAPATTGHASTPRPRAYNSQTGAYMEYNGTAWVPAQ